jgi:hypothetical protein
MSDGTEALDQITPDLPASGEGDASSLATHDASSELEQDSEPGEGQPLEDEFEELEWDGEKYSIPKKLKPGFMMHADYTRKTQEVSETRRALDARQAEIEQQARAVTELNDDRKKLVLIDDYLERQSKVDWNRLFTDDPLDAPRKWAEYQHWQGQRTQLNSKITETEQKSALDEERKAATRVQEVMSEVRMIPGWSDDVGKKVEAHAVANGMDIADLNKAIIKHGAPFVKVLHKAYLADQLIAKQQAAKPSASQQEHAQPLTTVSKGKPQARAGLSDTMSASDWVKAREQQLRNRNR